MNRGRLPTRSGSQTPAAASPAPNPPPASSSLQKQPPHLPLHLSTRRPPKASTIHRQPPCAAAAQVIVITDGEPTGEPAGTVANVIKGTKNLVGNSQYGPGAVAFEVAQVRQCL